MSMETASVIFEELESCHGVKIGHVKLANARALNALALGMIDLLYAQLKKWQQDENIAMVYIDGDGDRAFCAGGDVVSMFHTIATTNSTPASSDEYALQTYFTLEYELDYLIHNYTKPLLVWGNGIVMGGGLGLMCGASHRIVTTSSRIAMPEITIGLYPDVGASFFLNHMPAGCGLFLGLTGASINAADALHTNLADYFVSDGLKKPFFEKLLSANWQRGSLVATLDEICETFQNASFEFLPQSHLISHQNWLHKLADLPSVRDTVKAILSTPSESDLWLSKAQKSLSHGSAVSAHIVFEQLCRAQNMSLSQCFQMELGLSCKAGEFGEFQEGVRALLVDKDGKPNWKYKTVEEVPESVVEYFFEAIWPAELHPLAHFCEV
ncbi:MAG: enoyl-CoA hydratase/isomerase family protein [Paraglaciecola sp.]|uniref:enoyl-CoA hydratase/isomerase family protein n=1 Tax=Paraglaciecola sp. TaxID=1920173 RepID=UPI0032981004